jgi:hypothetical protein
VPDFGDLLALSMRCWFKLAIMGSNGHITVIRSDGK